MLKHGQFFAGVVEKRGDSEEHKSCISQTVNQLAEIGTGQNHPGILLGRIQSGKTRAFLGTIALAFDNGFDVCIILTKGTNTLIQQTLKRTRKDFEELLNQDIIQIHDIMQLPQSFSRWELEQKFIFIVKKEKHNLHRCLQLLTEEYPSLSKRRTLIVDDEADLASVSFRRERGTGDISAGKLSSIIDQIRTHVTSCSYLQVTATPYSLYLQPDDYDNTVVVNPVLPKRPAFTEILPTHPEYVGGEFFFEESSNPASIAADTYIPVSQNERDALHEEDGRRLKLEEVLFHNNCQALRTAILNFIMGGCIRRMQQKYAGDPEKKYAFVVHTEQQKRSHEWQSRVVQAIKSKLEAEARVNSNIFKALCRDAYNNITISLGKTDLWIPPFEEAYEYVREAIGRDFLMVAVANSDQDLVPLLNDNGQLKLRTPLNLFIGGQYLDRGITIDNMIGFYYGRNPKTAQQDTVLQHARIYGTRHRHDLAVTRFYTTAGIHQMLSDIHEFDSALREAFLKEAQERGVYFVRRDDGRRVRPCSPNKVMLSNLTSLRSGKRLLPIGFQTVARSRGMQHVENMDRLVSEYCGSLDPAHPALITTVQLEEIVATIKQTIGEFAFPYDSWNWNTLVAAAEHYSRISPDGRAGSVLLMAASGRDIARIRAHDGKPSDAPDSQVERTIANQFATHLPMLWLLRQEGLEEKGWRGMPFWWPVLFIPSAMAPTIFAEVTAEEEEVDDTKTVVAA